jgi:hypothetical protein
LRIFDEEGREDLLRAALEKQSGFGKPVFSALPPSVAIKTPRFEGGSNAVRRLGDFVIDFSTQCGEGETPLLVSQT